MLSKLGQFDKRIQQYKYRNPLTKSREIRKFAVVLNLLIIEYCNYKFILQERERERVVYYLLIALIVDCRKRCKIIRGMLVKIYTSK